MTAVPSRSIDSSQPIRRQGRGRKNKTGWAVPRRYRITPQPSLPPPYIHPLHSFIHPFTDSFIHFNTAAEDQDRRAGLALITAQSGFRTCYMSLGGNEYWEWEKERADARRVKITDSHLILTDSDSWVLYSRRFIQNSIASNSSRLHWRLNVIVLTHNKSTWMLLSFFVSWGTAVNPIATERECEWGTLLMVWL